MICNLRLILIRNLPRIYFIIILIISLVCSSIYMQAQDQKDSVDQSLTRRAFNKGLRLISTNPNDTILNEESKNEYAQFEGKIIRKIDFERVGFETSIYDSTKKVRGVITRAANAIHTDTREKVIRQHLFLEKNTPLNPNKLADNERFLRDKDFILDSRIIVTEVNGTDSVDLTVVTRDVFSLGARAGGSFPNAPKLGIYDANVGGLGQRMELNTLFDQDRTPKFGYAVSYGVNSLLGSLTNVELVYSKINTGFSIGDESESAVRLVVSRPLVSPYSRLAGGMEISYNWSNNVYTKPDSAFLNYAYRVNDAWIGYNFGVKNKITNRNRHFFAIRALDYFFTKQPTQSEFSDLVIYNNASAVLSEFTFYRQDFFKTRYVYGFGRTEDIPYGITMGVTSGYVRQLDSDRFYSAYNFTYSHAHRKGDFQNFYFQTASYFQQSKAEDIVVDVGTTYNSRLFQLKRYKMRTTVSTTFTKLFNHNLSDWIEISKTQIPGFRTDSLQANTRLSFHIESVLFTHWSFFGFRFAPFAGIDLATIRCVSCETTSSTFWGLSSGLRTRNENLIFGTMEFKLTFIPVNEFGNNQFVFGFKQNLRVKSTGSFVRAPTLINYNN
jgi:hypothetical protein